MGAPFRPSNPPAPRGGTRSYKNDDTGTMAAKGIGRRSYRERNLAENGNYLSGRTIIITITNNNNNKKGRVCILYHDSLTTRRDGRTERRIPPITGRPGRESGRTPPPTNFTSPPGACAEEGQQKNTRFQGSQQGRARKTSVTGRNHTPAHSRVMRHGKNTHSRTSTYRNVLTSAVRHNSHSSIRAQIGR